MVISLKHAWLAWKVKNYDDDSKKNLDARFRCATDNGNYLVNAHLIIIRKLRNKSNDILQRYLRMNEVTTASQQIITNLNNYLLDPTANHKQQLEKSIAVIEEVQQDVAELRNVENAFSITNYIHLIDSFIETTNRSIMFSEEQEMEGSTKEFNEANRISMYISEMTLTILDRELKTSNRFYRGIIKQSEELKKLGIWLLLLITVVLLLAITGFHLVLHGRFISSRKLLMHCLKDVLINRLK